MTQIIQALIHCFSPSRSALHSTHSRPSHPFAPSLSTSLLPLSSLTNSLSSDIHLHQPPTTIYTSPLEEGHPKEKAEMPQTPSTRWCPTPDQLMILEEMYRSGVRTPNAVQIQQITTHLSYYGKIEGKNVFYWFQNHKARDRQKLRRKLSNASQHHAHPSHESAPPPPSQSHSPTNLSLSEGSSEETAQGMDLLGKLETGGSQREEAGVPDVNHGCTLRMDVGSSSPLYGYRPLQTLDLFPTKSSDIRDECSSSNSKSSSCSAYTN